MGRRVLVAALSVGLATACSGAPRSNPEAVRNRPETTVAAGLISTTTAPVHNIQALMARLSLRRQQFEAAVNRGKVKVPAMFGVCAYIMSNASKHVDVVPNPALVQIDVDGGDTVLNQTAGYDLEHHRFAYGIPVLITGAKPGHRRITKELPAKVSEIDLNYPDVEHIAPADVGFSSRHGHFVDSKSGKLVMNIDVTGQVNSNRTLDEFVHTGIGRTVCNSSQLPLSASHGQTDLA